MMETNEHRSILSSMQKSIDEIKASLEEIKSLAPEMCCNEVRDKKGSLDPRLCGHWKDPHAIG